GRSNSVNVQKVMWTIGELGLAHERLDVGGQFGRNDEDWYLAMNPMGRVPVLDDNGYVLWESHAIVRYLAAMHSPGELYPEDPQARGDAEKWMDWKLGFLQPPMTVVFWGLVRTPPEQRDMEAIRANAKQAEALFTLLDRHLESRDYIAASHLTIGDIPVGAMTYRWYGLDIEHPELPALRAWYERLTQRQAFADHVMLPIT
ncbi:MAG TPA: glutathione S-transferase, partial [Alphaproteobacteria bacterium]|nr:glutathione S-transferase [Alphaproteobacteria bacterium]